MNEKGMYINQGGRLTTTYPEQAACTWDQIEDFYATQYNIAKSAGAAIYTTDRENGYANAIYGKYITAGMFMNDNIFTALGARPYQTEGVRIAPKAATYGKATAADIASGLTGFTEGDFVGLGATTVQDGKVPDTVNMPVTEIREPSKDLPLKFNYGMYLSSIENKDDVITKRDYLDKISRNYSDLADKSVLRPIQMKQPLFQGVETSLNSIYRIMSGFKEIDREVGGVTIDAGMVSPYGGLTADRGDMYKFRSAGKSNMDSNLLDLKGGVLSFADMRKIYRVCQVNWADSGAPNNKAWFVSNVAQDKLGALAQANNTLLNTVYVQRDFNGVKTVPGRDAGLVLKSYNNIPMIQSGNINFDYKNEQVSETVFGDITLADLDHIWMSLLTPVQLYTANNPAITGILQEINVLHMRMETRVDSFIQHGRIVGAADDTF